MYTDLGKVLISAILGLGLATLFQTVCKDKDCIAFRGPILSEMDGKVVQHGNECYKYNVSSHKRDNLKKQILLP